MHQGNWTCSGCEGTITELPFEPRSDKGLLCKECHRGKGTTHKHEGDRPRIEGNWTCSRCSAPITSLPFTPRDTENLKCIECFKKSRG